MDIQLGSERIFVLEEREGVDALRQRAMDRRTQSFGGGLGGLLQRPKAEDVVRFQEIVRKAGVNAHVRKSRGRDIDAACGQLRRKEQEKHEQEQHVTIGQSTRL